MKHLFPYLPILFVLFTACHSCTRTEQADSATIILLNLSSPEKELALSEFVDSVSTLRLVLPDSLFFGQVSSILTDKENIYAKDSKQDTFTVMHPMANLSVLSLSRFPLYMMTYLPFPMEDSCAIGLANLKKDFGR